MLACAMLLSAAMFAQQGEKSVGANLKYRLDDPNNIGVGAKFQYGFTDKIRGEASFNYFLKKDYTSFYDVNINAHYLIPVGSLTVYPLAGVTLQGWNVEVGGYSADDSDVGVNVGAGIEYPLNDKLKVNAEFTYKYVKDADSPFIGLGIAYKF